MLPPNQQCNYPLSPKQIAIVSENIASRQEELRFADNVILKEQTKSADNAAAIAHLEPAIARAKLAIESQKQALNELKNIKTTLNKSNSAANPNWADESSARELCKTTMTLLESQITAGLKRIDEHISLMEENIPLLATALQEVEVEVYHHRLNQDATTQHITSLVNQKKVVEENIKLLRGALNPVKNTPAEIWAKIFAIRTNEDMELYFSNPSNQLISSTALNLSQVCRFWRHIILSEKHLWQNMAIYPDSQWLPSKIELLKHNRSLNPGAPTFVYDMTRAVTWNQSYDPYRGNYHRSVSIGASEISIFDNYSLRLLTHGYDNGAQPLATVSFRQPKSLILQIISNIQQGYLATLLGPLSNITSLEVIAKGTYTSTPPQFSTTQPSLAYLRLNLTTFQPFDIAGYLSPSLQELHIHHNGVNALSFSAASLQLPKLKVLGITPPDMTFTNSLRLPKLARIVLYGPKTLTIARVSLNQFANSEHFKRMRELELRDWKIFKRGSDDEWSVMNTFEEIVAQMRSISTLHLVDSHIDGTRLFDIIDTLKDTTQAEDSLMSEVVVDCCSGITRDECEAIANMVGKVEVCV
ncbi:hypothetical protein M408DRAFT_131809 [Serendipita vermifera MAFF 305830]|uniref:F-box domain-containing protein n=1 Tax=Serendipita vermifera MAFF 305830 TaxID=933852 RepID=A0A0C3B9E3_SERVB|nr:hypothetical protein M408DRAFT_131809 [Serendipita vermifera MAFF 305830]